MTAQRENGPKTLEVHSAFSGKTILSIQELFVALLRKTGRQLRYILLENSDRFFAVRLVVEPIDRLNVAADESDHQTFILSGPRAPRCSNVALIRAYHFRNFGKLDEMLLLRYQIERSREQCARLLLVTESIPSLGCSSNSFDGILAFIQAISSVNSTAITYTHKGRQYVTIVSRLGRFLATRYAARTVPTGGSVWTFALTAA
jgi:hypothetical protein